jgi:hypothetical protein
MLSLWSSVMRISVTEKTKLATITTALGRNVGDRSEGVHDP